MVDTKIQEIKGGRWRYKLTVSLKFVRSTIQRYANSIVDVGVGVTSLRCALEICEVYHTKIRKFKGGRWRYKITLCH